MVSIFQVLFEISMSISLSVLPCQTVQRVSSVQAVRHLPCHWEDNPECIWFCFGHTFLSGSCFWTGQYSLKDVGYERSVDNLLTEPWHSGKPWPLREPGPTGGWTLHFFGRGNILLNLSFLPPKNFEKAGTPLQDWEKGWARTLLGEDGFTDVKVCPLADPLLGHILH